MSVLLVVRLELQSQMFTIRSHLDQLCCSPALLPLVVSHGGNCYVLHQALKPFIPGHEIRLTVDLNTAEGTTGGAVVRATLRRHEVVGAHLHDDRVLV